MVLIRYCEKCGIRVTEKDIEVGDGVVVDGNAWCKAHQHLAPKPRRRTPASNGGARRAKSRTVRVAKRPPTRAIKHSSASRNIPHPASNRPSQKNTRLLFIGIIVPVVAVIVYFLVTSSDSPQESDTLVTQPNPAASAPPPSQHPRDTSSQAPGQKTPFGMLRPISKYDTPAPDTQPESNINSNAAQFVDLQDGLVAYWPFDETQGLIAKDMTGKHNGSLQNGAQWTDGVIGGGLKLNGDEQYVKMLSSWTMPTDHHPRTVCVWVKPASISPGDRTIFSYGDEGREKVFFLEQKGASLLGGNVSEEVRVDDFWKKNAWRHVTLTYDGANAIIYADGVFIRQWRRNWYHVNGPMYAGKMRKNRRDYFIGVIDELRVYDKVLSADVIKKLARGNFTIPEAPSDLNAVPVSATSVKLTWTDNSQDEAAYKILRGTESYLKTIAYLDKNVVSYSDNTLAPETAYVYSVAAWNPAGDSPPSRQVSITTPPDTTPPEIQSIYVFEFNPTTITVDFSEPVSDTDASISSHYAITGGDVAITQATPSGDFKSVTLTTAAPLSTDTSYTLAVSDIHDRAKKPNMIPPGSTQDFTVTPSVSGFRAEYYPTKYLKGTPVIRIDPEINFPWKERAPTPNTPKDNFSVRWTGKILPAYSETYTLTTVTDDGVRLWVNGILLIEEWRGMGDTPFSVDVLMTAHVPVDIKMEMFDQGGPSSARLYWESPSQQKEIIPSENIVSLTPRRN